MRRLLQSTLLTAALSGTASSAFAAGLDTLKPGEWYAFPDSQMNKVDPCPQNNCSYSATEKQAAVMDDWSGGAYDTKRNRLIVWGGGHGGYAGNEVYVFDINTGKWSLASQPTDINASDPAPPNTTAYYHDGTPSARHTYAYLVYAPNVDLFFSMMGGGTFGGAGDFSYDVDSFDFTSGTWKTDWPDVTGQYGQIGTVAEYDTVTNTIWVHPTASSPLNRFNPAATSNHFTVYPKHIYLQIGATAAIDTKRHKMVAVGRDGGGSQLYVWDLNNPGAAPTTPVTSGDAGGIAIESVNGPGFVYDPLSDRFVAWNGGTAVYLLNPADWKWSRVNAAATNSVDPGAPNKNGTYGRFRYVPSKNVFIVVNRTNELVYAYKLTDGASPAPTVSLSANPNTVSYSGSTTITWVSADAFSCSPSGDWAGVKDLSGTEAVTGLLKTSTFNLTCSGLGGDAQASTNVTVTGANAGAGPGSGGGAASKQTTSSGTADGVSLLAALSYALYSRARRRRLYPRGIPV